MKQTNRPTPKGGGARRLLAIAALALLIAIAGFFSEPPTVSGEEVEKVPQAVKEDSLRFRSTRRAFNGAPPVIPHEIMQRETEDCLGCHEDGGDLDGDLVPKISHRHLVNCLQCHAPVAETVLGPPAAMENSFEGLPEPLGGDRAWQGAPPTIPHTTRMRSDCLSCHGEFGRKGIQTPHPERKSCLQCHGPSAQLDQRM